MKNAKTIFARSDAALNVAVLVLDDCNTLSFAAGIDPMRAANRRAGTQLFNWQFYTATGKAAQLTSGLQITGPPIADLTRCDLLLFIAGFRLEEHATPRLLASLRRIAGTGATIAAIDGAPWLLARAGLLDGHNATTHWEDLEDFATRFPNVHARRDRFVISGQFATSSGATPGLDMMLHMIRNRYGDTLATRVASVFLYDPVPVDQQHQSPRSTAHQIRRNPLLARALSLMESNLEEPIPIPKIAARLNLSVRTLETRFKSHLGQSPASYYLTLRLTEAHRLATDTSQSAQTIAIATGFSSQSSFARAFKKHHSVSLRALREMRLR